MVAGAVKADLLADLGQAVEKAILEGTSLEGVPQRLPADRRDPRLAWLDGRGDQEGRSWRTRVIYRTNAATSYAPVASPSSGTEDSRTGSISTAGRWSPGFNTSPGTGWSFRLITRSGPRMPRRMDGAAAATSSARGACQPPSASGAILSWSCSPVGMRLIRAAARRAVSRRAGTIRPGTVCRIW